MIASEYLNRSKRDRVIDVVLMDETMNEPAGKAAAFVINSKNRIAILLTDCGSAEATNLRAGDFIEFADDPHSETQRILSADSLRPDAYIASRVPGCHYL